jgi:hypothetical protein
MPPQTPVAPQKPVSIPFRKKIPAWGYAVAALFSIIITLAEGYPWLSVQRGGMLDAGNPYSEMFEVSNGGYVPLTNLDVVCIPSFETPRAEIKDNNFEFNNAATYLSHGQTVTMPCFNSINMHHIRDGAELAIFVTYAFYHLNLGFLRRSQVFHFRSLIGRDGTYHWAFVSPR